MLQPFFFLQIFPSAQNAKRRNAEFVQPWAGLAFFAGSVIYASGEEMVADKAGMSV